MLKKKISLFYLSIFLMGSIASAGTDFSMCEEIINRTPINESHGGPYIKMNNSGLVVTKEAERSKRSFNKVYKKDSQDLDSYELILKAPVTTWGNSGMGEEVSGSYKVTFKVNDQGKIDKVITEGKPDKSIFGLSRPPTHGYEIIFKYSADGQTCIPERVIFVSSGEVHLSPRATTFDLDDCKELDRFFKYKPTDWKKVASYGNADDEARKIKNLTLANIEGGTFGNLELAHSFCNNPEVQGRAMSFKENSVSSDSPSKGATAAK